MAEETSLPVGMEESAADAAMDGIDEAAFLDALGDAPGGDQTGETAESGGEAASGGGGDQTGAQEAEAEPEAEPAAKPEENRPPSTATMTLRNLDRSYALPADAVQAVARALGVTPDAAIALVQKGMNYDNKGAREARLLEGLAKGAGMDYNAFLAQAENEQRGLRVQAEMQRVRATLPDGTPDEALRQIAENNLAQQRAREQIEAAKTRRAQALSTENARIEPFRELLRARPEIKGKGDIPEAAWTLIREGVAPLAAVLQAERDEARRQAEEASKALRAAQKNNQNRKQAAGSMATGGAPQADPFLEGLLG